MATTRRKIQLWTFVLLTATTVAVPLAAQPILDSFERGEARWIDFVAGMRSHDIRAFAIDPQNGDRLYAASPRHLYRSLDGGNSWDVVLTLQLPASAADTDEGVSELTQAQVEAFSEEQIEAINERFLELSQELFDELVEELGETTAALSVEAAADDLLREAAEDVGQESANPIEEESPDDSAEGEFSELEPGFTSLAVDSSNTARLYAASSRGLYGSRDHGRSWSRVFRGTGAESRYVTSVVSTGQIVVIGTADGVRRSGDAGVSWGPAARSPGNVQIDWVTSAESAPHIFYLSAESRIYRSDDGGSSWFPKGQPQGVRRLNMIAVSDTDPDHIFLASDSGALQSFDAGATYDYLGSVGLRSRDVRWIVPRDETCLVGAGDGVYMSRRTADHIFDSWTGLHDGLAVSEVGRVRVGPNGTVWSSTDRGIFRLIERAELQGSEATRRSISERWLNEPSLALTLDAALRVYGLHDFSAANWGRRAFWSRMVPSMRLQWLDQSRRDEHDIFLPGAGGDPRISNNHVRRDDDEEFRVLFRWDLLEWLESGQLGRTRISSERLPGGATVQVYSLDPRDSAAGVAQSLTQTRNEVLQRVIRTFQDRRNLMVRMSGERATTLSRRVNDWLELEELTARLDLMTGGFFSAYTGMAQ